MSYASEQGVLNAQWNAAMQADQAAMKALEVEEQRLQTAITENEMQLVAQLRPRISIDGNQWCVLYGENLQDGVAGFGDTPMLAVYAFNKEWHRKIGEPNAQGETK